MQGTTLVYNLRIRRTFGGLGTLLKLEKDVLWIATAVPIFYRRTAHIISERFKTDVFDKRIGGGSVFNLRYVPSRTWWFEATTAVQKESLKTRGTSNFRASRAGFDDVVLAGGYNAFPSKDMQVTLYGLAGFPTRRSVTIQESEDRLVGTRFYAVGFGNELSYSFINSPKNLFAGILQVRFIHFFTRRWEPILGPGSKIRPGQTTDILLAFRYRHKLTVVETGYNPTIFTSQAFLLPGETVRAGTQVRHGTYLNVLHLFKNGYVINTPIALGGGFLFNRLKTFDANSFSIWLTFAAIF